MERLRKETLGTAGARHDKFVFVGKLVYAENRDNILKFVVFLQELLYSLSGIVMVLAYDVGIENA